MNLPTEPFRYQSAAGPDKVFSGPAYTLAYRLAASVMALGCCIWFARLYGQGRIELGTPAAKLYVGGALLVLLCLLVFIWRSRTTLSAHELTQSWIKPKRMAVRDLVYVRLFRWPGLSWLIAPRLYARTMDGKFASFYMSTPEMLDEAARLTAALNDWRARVVGQLPTGQ